MCPMTSAALLPGAGGFSRRVGKRRAHPACNEKVPGEWASDKGDGQKLPVFARHEGSREMVVAWTEGMGWNKGGALAWREVAETGAAAGPGGRLDGVPANGSLAAVALPGGKFVIFY